MELIRNAKVRGPKYVATKMTQEDFHDFDALRAYTTKNPRKHPKEATFSEAAYFRVSKDYECGYEYSTNYLQLRIDGNIGVSHSPMGNVMRVAKGAPRKKDNSRANEQFKLAMAHFRPPKKYLSPLPLGRKKFLDLQSYVPDLVPNTHLRSYWNQILIEDADLHCNNVNNAEEDLFYTDICTDYD